MKNKMIGKVTLTVLFDTDMDVEEILIKFQEDNFIAGKANFVISDGSENEMDILDIENGIIHSFMIDGEETVEDQIVVKKQEVTKPVVNLVTKIPSWYLISNLPNYWYVYNNTFSIRLQLDLH